MRPLLSFFIGAAVIACGERQMKDSSEAAFVSVGKVLLSSYFGVPFLMIKRALAIARLQRLLLRGKL